MNKILDYACSRDPGVGELRVLDAGVPAEQVAWLEAWEAWPGREVFAHPDYVRLFARDVDQVLCASLRTEGGGVLFPFVLRPLGAEPWGKGSRAVDLVSPYGYGGPFVYGRDTATERVFWSAFDRWAEAARCVSAFARLSLFPEQLLSWSGEVSVSSLNVVRTLEADPEVIWREYAPKVRKNVKRAKRCRLTVELDYTGERLDDFLEIYYGTMDRRGAQKSYYFSRDFFERIVAQLRDGFAFFHVLAGARLVSTELVLVSANHVYSFLGGTVADAFEFRPNDLLKHEVIAWASTLGKRAFVLGGGLEPDDGIYKYKMSFAPDGVVPFAVGRRVFEPAQVRELVQARSAWDAGREIQYIRTPGFFPPYR